jgi:NADH dehydrogenase
MKIAITGATGYIGQRVVRAALIEDHNVLALSRNLPYFPGISWQHFDLNDAENLSLPSDIEVIIHLAADTLNAEGSGHIEITAAKILIFKAREIGAKLIFVSSQTARIDAPTGYGRIKWQIEKLFLDGGGWVVRPGFVYGGVQNGLYGRLCKLVRRLPLLPAFIPAPVIQLVHVDDLAKALITCFRLAPPSILCVADNNGTSFTRFLEAISLARSGKFKFLLPVPTLFIRGAIHLLPSNINSKLGLDRLKSLLALPRMNTLSDLQTLSLSLRSLNVGITRSGSSRRALLFEGRTFLSYILRSPPQVVLLKRYVKAMEILKNGAILRLPLLVKINPAFLTFFETAGGVDESYRIELRWRLNAASVLAEASPNGAARFLGQANQHFSLIEIYISMLAAVVLEVMRRLVEIIFSPILRRMGTQQVFE